MTYDIGRAIRIVRIAKGLRVSSLAKKAKLSVPFVSLVENGERQPSLDAVRRMATALGVPFEALIVLAQPRNGRLKTGDSTARRLAAKISKLMEAEESLRVQLDRDGRRATK